MCDQFPGLQAWQARHPNPLGHLFGNGSTMAGGGDPSGTRMQPGGGGNMGPPHSPPMGWGGGVQGPGGPPGPIQAQPPYRPAGNGVQGPGMQAF